MAANALDHQLAELEASRYRFSRHEAAHIVKLLRTLKEASFPNPACLIRFHEALAWIHGPGMILTPVLGAMAYKQENAGEKVHWHRVGTRRGGMGNGRSIRSRDHFRVVAHQNQVLSAFVKKPSERLS